MLGWLRRQAGDTREQRLVVSARVAAPLIAISGALFLLVVGATPASAHAALPTIPVHAAYKSSIPAANSVVKVAPTVVSITFVQRLSPQNLSVVVYDKDAKVVSTGTAQISATDPYTATVTMKGDGSDIYRVDWNDVSAEDSDPTVGAFVFGVDPSGATDKVPPITTTVVQDGVAPWLAALIGVAGLVVGAGGMFFSIRRRA